ncbi:MAG: HEAT repeat domain-containing protein [Spirochaetales bacterium]|nr:HEAT repeat domain-containing protein [Spirochaetales bacterium]
MEILPGLIIPLWEIILVITAATALLLFIIIKLYLNYRFSKKCDRLCYNEKLMADFKAQYTGKKLLHRTGLIEKSAIKHGTTIIKETGLDKLWEEELNGYLETFYLKKIIRFFPELGLFYCLKNGDKRKKYKRLYKKTEPRLSENFLLKRIAAAGKGMDFNGKYALSIVEEKLTEIFEMAVDPEWEIRFFAFKILIHSEEERAARLLWEAFSDPSDKIRTMLSTEFISDDKEKLVLTLTSLLLDDPAFFVRQAARKRLDKDYSELYQIDLSKLSKTQIIHLLGQLQKNSDKDEKIAFSYLTSEDLEIRSYAALYLQKRGSLRKLFVKAVTGDKEGTARTTELLKSACEVNTTLFLSEINQTDNPATLNLAAKLLKKTGDRSYINMLAEKVFSEDFKEKAREYYFEIYQKTVECISARGTDKALELLNNELLSNYKTETAASIILPLLPLRGDAIFVPTLLTLLKNDDVPNKKLLRETFERFPVTLYIEDIVSFIKTPPTELAISIKKEAYKILGELKLSYCLQLVLENMKLLDYQEQKEFAIILKSYDEARFIQRVHEVLETCDSKIKTSIMNALPATGIKDFITEIEAAAQDPDPDIRIASIRSLGDFGETQLLNKMTSMLRDPIERVRKEAAKVIAEHGTVDAIKKLEEILSDDNEVLPVKTAAVYGLGQSEKPEAIKILVEYLEDAELRKSVITALSRKTSEEELKLLVELFKDAAPQLREYIASVFKMMGSSCETAIVNLLKEQNPTIKDSLAEILLKIGYIDALIVKLRHRKPAKRKKAAFILALIHTKESFKGMLLASRDPNSEVRVEVLKALEKLNLPEYSSLLEELKSDPDKRVRKYTLWVIERLKAKNIDE